jgi:hypothetical protein
MIVDCLQEGVHIITNNPARRSAYSSTQGLLIIEYETYSVYYTVLDDEYIDTKKESNSGRMTGSNKQSEEHRSIFGHAR